MPEIINCPRCQRRLHVPDSLIGQEVQCPACEATFEASLGGTRPTAQAASPAQPPPPPAGDDEHARPMRRGRFEDYEDEDDDDDFYRLGPRRDLNPHRGAMILTFGILGLILTWVCLPLGIFGPIAWAMGSTDLSEIRAGRMDPDGEGMTRAGQICGIIGTVLFILAILFTCGVFGLMFLSARR